MLFSYSKEKNHKAKKVYGFGKRFFNILDTENELNQITMNNGDVIFWAGELYYTSVSGRSPQKVTLNNQDEKLLQLYAQIGSDPYAIKNSLEGAYVIVHYLKNENRILVYGDYLNRLNLFYTTKNNSVIVSLSLTKSFVATAGNEINPIALGSILHLNYCIDEDTIYQNIKRLGFQQVLYFNPDGHYVDTKTDFQKTEDYGEGDQAIYNQLLKNAVTMRMGSNHNVIMCSGGWDSTTLMDLVCENADSQNVTGVIMEAFMKDGRSYNIFEVQKAQLICEHYGIPLKNISIDLNSQEYCDSFIKYMDNMSKNHLFALCHHFFYTGAIIKEQFGQSTTVFDGQASDSLHNFGFSQYISIIFGHDGFKEYADKMKNYLFSPSFLKKVLDNQFADDFIYRMYQWQYQLKNVNDQHNTLTSRLFYYLFPFIYSAHRIPFVMEGFDCYTKDFYNNYFLPQVRDQLSKELENLHPEKIYSILTRIYCRFWLKGSNIMRSYRFISDFGLKASVPFMDTGLVKFLEKMPESWGRGLEWNHVKYPLKKFVSKRSTYPYDIISKGPHSYLSDVEVNGPNLNYEYICNSTATEYLQELLSDRSNRVFLDQPAFDVVHIEQVIEDFLSNKTQMKDVNLLQQLAFVIGVVSKH